MNGKIYQNLIAGRVPAIKGKTQNAVALVASAALQTPKVHMAMCEHDGFAYYLAAGSADFASEQTFSPELSAALPGHPGHKGEGVYVQYEDGSGRVIILAGDRFEYVTGAAESISDMVQLEGLPVHLVDGVMGWPLRSAVGRAETHGHQFGLALAKFATAWLALAGLTLIGLHVATLFVKTVTQQELNDAYFAATAQITTAQPLSTDLAAIDKVSNVAVRAGGWIDALRREKGVETFTVSLPQWTSKDHVQALGPGVVTDIDRMTGLVIATKAIPKKTSLQAATLAMNETKPAVISK